MLTESVESALVELYTEVGGPTRGAALAAVGSLARRELGPRSDIDLVLLHSGKSSAKINTLASDLWYPLWDARIRVDHAVRTPEECADIAGRELSAGVGLLDLRVITGDAELVKGARTALLGNWRGHTRKRLPELLASLDERLANFGDAAYLLEPDLKEARGGFRDVSMLRALAASWLTDRPHVGIGGPYQRLLDVRDALHLASGRTLDRLISSETQAVATRLGYGDADDLRRDVSLAARRIGHAVDVDRFAKMVLTRAGGPPGAASTSGPHIHQAGTQTQLRTGRPWVDHLLGRGRAEPSNQRRRSRRWTSRGGAGRAARAGPLPRDSRQPRSAGAGAAVAMARGLPRCAIGHAGHRTEHGAGLGGA